MNAKRAAVLVAILAIAVVGVGPAAAMFGQPDGVYAVTETAGGTSVSANIIVLLRPHFTALIELRADGTWAGSLATLGSAVSGVRLTGTEFTAQGTSAGIFDLTIDIDDTMSGTITRTTGGSTQTFSVSGEKVFDSDGNIDGVYAVQRRFHAGAQANTGPEFVIVLIDETRLTDAVHLVGIVYLASDGRFYTAPDYCRCPPDAGGPLWDGFGNFAGVWSGFYARSSGAVIDLQGELNIANGVPSFAPGNHTVFVTRAL